jgi:hypothetical protein
MKTTRNQVTLDKNIQLLDFEFLTGNNFKYLGAVVAETYDTNIETKAILAAANTCVFAA